MKLRNKITGEINILKVDEDYFIIYKDDGEFVCPVTLKELNEGWEDYYEEPKGYYYVTTTGLIKYDDTPFCAIHKDRKEIGNYFATEEEAEKVVEKLEAIKRLKAHDLFISKGNRTFVNTDDVFVVQNVQFRIDTYGDVEEDLDLLFGGEE